MTYAIGNIIYGVDLTDTYRNSLYDKYSADFDILLDECIIEEHYSDSNEISRYLGVRLASINECTHHKISDLQLYPAEKQKQTYFDNLNSILVRDDISSEFKKYLTDTVPQSFITWSSS